nr:CbtB-domain containing protein [Rhodoplanes roseus]
MLSGTGVPPAALPVIPLREIAPWAVFASLLALLAVWFVGAEQGAVAMIDGNAIHEFVHDARHLLGFPCH